ncbi:DASH complex subunit Dad4 [Auriculariales sp. MPI-PUGE-AT-0066]|nr:DASH complex subunit Dad4 [Auriculariales sp. MPI-PUGE-AT-0066]
MENPHTELQNVLLERILKNIDKCHEAMVEINHNLEMVHEANEGIPIAADLTTRYRKNVAYNLEATGLLPSAEIEKRTSGDS